MKSTKVLAILQSIDDWTQGKTDIQSVCELLGDDTNEVGRMLMLNGIADFAYKPMEGFSYQAVVNNILLYIAMREGLQQKAKK